MTDPDVREVSGEPPTNIVPLMQGEFRGERFVVSVDHNATALYVQFEGWICEYSIEQMLAESAAEVWGNVGTPDDIDFDFEEDTN